MILIGLFLGFLQGVPAEGRVLKVVTTTPNLASICQDIGGEKVVVTSLTKGNQDPHFIEPRPSMIPVLRDTDLFIVIGMELDVWAFSLINAAKNRRIVPGGIGYLNASSRIEKLEVPPAGVRIDASRGHVHPAGNPHYWLDPQNGVIIAETIADKLAELAPEEKEYFQSNLTNFKKKIQHLITKMQNQLAPFRKIKILTYHKSWSYFCKRFGIKIVGELEPLPGVAPSPKHLSETIELVKRENVPLIIQEVFYPRRAADFVAGKTNVRVVVVPNSVGGVAATKDYPGLFEVITQRMVEALKAK